MSYKTYTTQAIVCGSTTHNTSDKNYLLFCRDAGMLFAHARSVREERSKQRYALQDFSVIRVSLLKGKHIWRIGSVEAHSNSFLAAGSRMQRGCASFVVSQLRTYVHGEEALAGVYDDAVYVLDHLHELEADSAQVKLLFSLRLLYALGYIPYEVRYAPVLDAQDFAHALAQYMPQMHEAIASAIQKGASASHL